MLARLEASADAQARFVADASHELRSPVATIRTLNEVGAARPTSTDWPAVTDEVLVEVHRLERLVDDLLLLARPRTGTSREVEVVDLGLVVGEEAARARRVPVSAAIARGVMVTGHPDRLARAVRNLLDNAERHAVAEVAVEVVAIGERGVVTVRDDGDGIPEQERERVFGRFVRLEEARSRDGGGSGLGLAIARHLVEAHGGHVRVGPSELGALLVVDLPLAEDT
jgi:signal transduction histidine kinase